MSDTTHRKSLLRSDLRRRRKALTPAQQLTAARALTASVAALPDWQNAARIAIYLAADGEIDTQPLAHMARSLEKQVFLPVIADKDRLGFALWDAGDPLTANRYNIPEPPDGATRCPVSELDIIFLPLVGWDVHGGRLGMGAASTTGRWQSTGGPLLVGLAHQQQQVEAGIPLDSWDIVLDYIATDKALYRRRRRQ
ncbi:MAG: 5-formyltetrahydrofolate cyclo-ligase [Halioglobus sp.]